MKNISLYIDQGSWLNKMHPYTKLLYILTAIMIPLTGGKLWLFPVMIVSSLVLLASGKILKRALPLVAFSFTLIVVIFFDSGTFSITTMKQSCFLLELLRFIKRECSLPPKSAAIS